MRKFIVRLKNTLLSLLNFNTIGVRAMVIHGNDILIVKHTYLPQLYHPGGNINCHETPYQAIKRELDEKVDIISSLSLDLFNIYYSNHEHRDNYIVFYIANYNGIKIDKINDKSQDFRYKWFNFNQLPKDILLATLRRIKEYLKIQLVSNYW